MRNTLCTPRWTRSPGPGVPRDLRAMAVDDGGEGGQVNGVKDASQPRPTICLQSISISGNNRGEH